MKWVDTRERVLFSPILIQFDESERLQWVWLERQTRTNRKWDGESKFHFTERIIRRAIKVKRFIESSNRCHISFNCRLELQIVAKQFWSEIKARPSISPKTASRQSDLMNCQLSEKYWNDTNAGRAQFASIIHRQVAFYLQRSIGRVEGENEALSVNGKLKCFDDKLQSLSRADCQVAELNEFWMKSKKELQSCKSFRRKTVRSRCPVLFPCCSNFSSRLDGSNQFSIRAESEFSSGLPSIQLSSRLTHNYSNSLALNLLTQKVIALWNASTWNATRRIFRDGI